MAKEIGASYLTGATVFAVLRNAVGQYYTGSAFEAWQDGHLSSYARALTEAGTSGDYYGDMPAVAAGRYAYTAYAQQGGSPALTDMATRVSVGGFEWSGTAVVGQSGDSFARLGAPAGASIAADLAEIEADVGSTTDPLTNAVPGGYADGTAGAALGRVGVSLVTVRSPVAANADTQIVAGDDYFAADARSLRYADADDAWPDNATAVWHVYAKDVVAPVLSVAASVSPATGAGKVATAELTSAQTAALQAGTQDSSGYRLALVFTRADGHLEELVTGKLTVLRRGVA